MLISPDQTLGFAQQKSLSDTVSVAILWEGHRYSDMAQGSPFFWLKIRALIFMGRILSWPPCCPSCLAAGGCYLWSRTRKSVLAVQPLHFTTARVGRSRGELRVETAKDAGTRPLPPTLLLQQWRFGRGEDGQLRATASLQSSYRSPAKRMLTYHYYWCCCYHYYCYYYIPCFIHPKETNPALLYIAVIHSPPTNVSHRKRWS